MNVRRASLSFIISSGFILSACAPINWIGLKFLYRKAELPAGQIIDDICYAPDDSCKTPDHKLDLYLPKASEWPVILFVHGGNWDAGDKQLKVGGADVYSNIGRFYAKNGIGVAVINYRLQPTTHWRGQIDDVKKALTWTQLHIAEFGGNPKHIFLMGHSAGAYLVSMVALSLNEKPETNPIRGVIAVSGAGLDMTDQKTYDMGEDIRFYEKRFRVKESGNDWKKVASPVTYITSSAPPFRILYAGGEKKTLQRQSNLLNDALHKNNVESRLVVVPGESHSRIVLTLSRPDKTAAPDILSFIKKN